MPPVAKSCSSRRRSCARVRRALPPRARRRRASAFCASVSPGGRPMCCPRFCARLRPSAVRVRIRSRSTSARPPRTTIISRPVLVSVSAQGSANERNCTLAGLAKTFPQALNTYRRSWASLPSPASRPYPGGGTRGLRRRLDGVAAPTRRAPSLFQRRRGLPISALNAAIPVRQLWYDLTILQAAATLGMKMNCVLPYLQWFEHHIKTVIDRG